MDGMPGLGASVSRRMTGRSRAEGLLEPAAVERRRAGASGRLKVHAAGEAALLPGRWRHGWGRARRLRAPRPPLKLQRRGGLSARRLRSRGPIGPWARPSPE